MRWLRHKHHLFYAPKTVIMCKWILNFSCDTICAYHSLKENVLFYSLQQELCQSDIVSFECTLQLVVSTEYVIGGSTWLWSRVPLNVFHVWDFPGCQNSSAAHLLLKCTMKLSPAAFNSVNTKCPFYVATITQQYNGYRRIMNVCCVVHFYHIRSQMKQMLMYWENDIKSTRVEWNNLGLARSIIWYFVNITIF